MKNLSRKIAPYKLLHDCYVLFRTINRINAPWHPLEEGILVGNKSITFHGLDLICNEGGHTQCIPTSSLVSSTITSLFSWLHSPQGLLENSLIHLSKGHLMPKGKGNDKPLARILEVEVDQDTGLTTLIVDEGKLDDQFYTDATWTEDSYNQFKNPPSIDS